MPDEAAAIVSDTRLLHEGDWYLALPGKQFDGHDFIGDAFSAGALGCIVEERGNYPIASTSFPLLAVDNTYEAFQQLARNWRKRLNPKVIAVSAAPGDCSGVARLCAHVLQDRFELLLEPQGGAESVLSTEISLDENVQLLIANVAPDQLGQSELLGRALAPTIVILTEEGFSHLRAANEDSIARAECNLLVHLEKNRGIGIVSRRSQDLLHRIKYHFPERTLLFDGAQVQSEPSTNGLVMRLRDCPQQFEIATACSAGDAWCVIAACRQLGLDDRAIAERLAVPAAS